MVLTSNINGNHTTSTDILFESFFFRSAVWYRFISNVPKIIAPVFILQKIKCEKVFIFTDDATGAAAAAAGAAAVFVVYIAIFSVSFDFTKANSRINIKLNKLDRTLLPPSSFRNFQMKLNLRLNDSDLFFPVQTVWLQYTNQTK